MEYPIRTSVRTGMRVFEQQLPRCDLCGTTKVKQLGSIKSDPPPDAVKRTLRYYECANTPPCINLKTRQVHTFKATVIKK